MRGYVRGEVSDLVKKAAVKYKIAGSRGDVMPQQLETSGWKLLGFFKLPQIVVLIGVGETD